MTARGGPQVTDRDVAILTWIGRHGIVTADQVAAKFFARDEGAVGKWAAYQRLGKLEDLHLIRRDVVFARWPAVLRLTGTGVRTARSDVAPAKLVHAEVRHSLALVDLTETLLRENPGSGIVTEREIRALRFRELAEHTRTPGFGRIPDGVLHMPDGRTIAIELDLTSKRQRDIERVITGYAQERYAAVWWFVRPSLAPRLRDVIQRNRADDMIAVREWQHVLLHRESELSDHGPALA